MTWNVPLNHGVSSLILRQQPVARDLRQISTALKVVTDLERIGDHASDIAELILRIKSDHAYHIVAASSSYGGVSPENGP